MTPKMQDGVRCYYGGCDAAPMVWLRWPRAKGGGIKGYCKRDGARLRAMHDDLVTVPCGCNYNTPTTPCPTHDAQEQREGDEYRRTYGREADHSRALSAAASAAVIDASDDDLRIAVARALERAGCTFDELAQQAEAGEFTSIQARLAWVAVGGLGDFAV